MTYFDTNSPKKMTLAYSDSSLQIFHCKFMREPLEKFVSKMLQSQE